MGRTPPATWRKVVHGSVGRLRHCLGAQAIATVDGGYRLELGDDQIDVRRFERLVADAERLADVGEPERAALRLAEALELAGGEPFVDLDGWEPGAAVAIRVARAGTPGRGAARGGVVGGGAVPGGVAGGVRAGGARAVAGAAVGSVGVGPIPGRAPGGGVADDPAGAADVDRRVGVATGRRVGRVGTVDPRSGSASDRSGAGGGMVGRRLPVSGVGRLRPRRRRLVLRA